MASPDGGSGARHHPSRRRSERCSEFDAGPHAHARPAAGSDENAPPVAGLPAERLVAPGQEFSGSLDPGALLSEFVPDPGAQDVPARVAEFVGDGVVTLARVCRVGAHDVELLVHPEYVVTVEDGGADLTALVRVDEVVTVELVPVDGALLASFSSDDPAPAMSVLPGGPPWLLPESPPSDEPVLDSNADVPETTSTSELWLYEQIEQLEQPDSRTGGRQPGTATDPARTRPDRDSEGVLRPRGAAAPRAPPRVPLSRVGE